MTLGRGVALAGALALAGARSSPAQPPGAGLFSAPITARFGGLGGASVAVIGHAASVFTNPAGLAPVRVLSLEGGYARLSDSSSYFQGAAAVRAAWLNVGGGLRYVRWDDGDARHLESVVGVAARVRGLALGAAAHYFAVEDGRGAISRSLTTDAALTIAVFDIAALAVGVQNIGRARLGGPGLVLPTTWSLGFSLNLIDTYSNGRLLATVERAWVEGEGQTIVALEGGAVFSGVGLVARVGAGGRPPGSALTAVAWGGSLVLGRAALDYAYLDRRAEPPLHVFGLRLTP